MNKNDKPRPEVCHMIPFHMVKTILHLSNAISISTNDGLSWYTKQIFTKEESLIGEFLANPFKVFTSVFVVIGDNGQDNIEDREWWIDSIWITYAQAEARLDRIRNAEQPTLASFADQLFKPNAITDYSKYVSGWVSALATHRYECHEWELNTDKQPEKYDSASDADTVSKQKDDEQYYSNFT